MVGLLHFRIPALEGVVHQIILDGLDFNGVTLSEGIDAVLQSPLDQQGEKDRGKRQVRLLGPYEACTAALLAVSGTAPQIAELTCPGLQWPQSLGPRVLPALRDRSVRQVCGCAFGNGLPQPFNELIHSLSYVEEILKGAFRQHNLQMC